MLESNNYETTTKEKGDSLEKAVEHIFRIASFHTLRNVFIAKYEIDVKATIGDMTVIIECKNYQNSNLTIRNLIHQWNSKNNLIKAQKVIIVLAGVKIKQSDHDLASEFDIELWDEKDLSDLFSLSLKPDELRQKLLNKISFKPLSIAERYREEITYLVIKPLLSNTYFTEESLYSYFNLWLRAHILTELQMENSTSEVRRKHIELFEGSKTKKGFFSIKKQRKQADYWNTVLDQLENARLLPVEQQNKYLSYMSDLLTEYQSQSKYFKGDDYLGKVRKLISSRLQNAIFLNQNCQFRLDKKGNIIEVIFLSEGNFSIEISNLNLNEINILNWILTSQCHRQYYSKINLYKNHWYCSSFEETTEKVYRVITEFLQITENDHLLDLKLN